MPTAIPTSFEHEKDSGGNQDNTDSCAPTRQGTHATQVLTTEVMVSVYYEAQFSAPTMYHGDHYPEHISLEKMQKLDRQYKAIKEEYYDKAGLSVTPENFCKWKQTSKAQKRSQPWDICSGSGRLSYLALLPEIPKALKSRNSP